VQQVRIPGDSQPLCRGQGIPLLHDPPLSHRGIQHHPGALHRSQVLPGGSDLHPVPFPVLDRQEAVAPALPAGPHARGFQGHYLVSQ